MQDYCSSQRKTQRSVIIEQAQWRKWAFGRLSASGGLCQVALMWKSRHTVCISLARSQEFCWGHLVECLAKIAKENILENFYNLLKKFSKISE